MKGGSLPAVMVVNEQRASRVHHQRHAHLCLYHPCRKWLASCAPAPRWLVPPCWLPLKSPAHRKPTMRWPHPFSPAPAPAIQHGLDGCTSKQPTPKMTIRMAPRQSGDQGLTAPSHMVRLRPASAPRLPTAGSHRWSLLRFHPYSFLVQLRREVGCSGRCRWLRTMRGCGAVRPQHGTGAAPPPRPQPHFLERYRQAGCEWRF